MALACPPDHLGLYVSLVTVFEDRCEAFMCRGPEKRKENQGHMLDTGQQKPTQAVHGADEEFPDFEYGKSHLTTHVHRPAHHFLETGCAVTCICALG